jgi:formate-dependent nitrite reductase membrane component NrfD
MSGPAAQTRWDGRRKRRDEPQPVAADSYYGMAVLNAPVWEEREVAGYLFLGGLSGASSILAAAADLSGNPRLADRSRLCASTAITVSLLALIKDLGRPERFYDMLRVFKPTSPMSVGTWIISTYAPLNFLASASTLTGRYPSVGRWSGIGAGVWGSLVATYTGALIADTAVPAWHGGHREMPFLFAGSSAMAAGGFGLLAAPLDENGAAWTLALMGAGVELVTEQLYERRLGLVAETLEGDTAGPRMRRAKALAGGGLALAVAGGRRSRLAATIAGGALMAASGFTRFGIFAAGMASAEDPRYTVEPQRQGIHAREAQPMSYDTAPSTPGLEVPSMPETPTPIIPDSPSTPMTPDPGPPSEPSQPATVPGPSEPAEPVAPPEPGPTIPPEPGEPEPVGTGDDDISDGSEPAAPQESATTFGAPSIPVSPGFAPPAPSTTDPQNQHPAEDPLNPTVYPPEPIPTTLPSWIKPEEG